MQEFVSMDNIFAIDLALVIIDNKSPTDVFARMLERIIMDIEYLGQNYYRIVNGYLIHRIDDIITRIKQTDEAKNNPTKIDTCCIQIAEIAKRNDPIYVFKTNKALDNGESTIDLNGFV